MLKEKEMYINYLKNLDIKSFSASLKKYQEKMNKTEEVMENQLNIKINAILDDESSEEFKVQVRKIVQDIIKEEIEKAFKEISFPQYVPLSPYPNWTVAPSSSPSIIPLPNTNPSINPNTIYYTGTGANPNLNKTEITCKCGE